MHRIRYGDHFRESSHRDSSAYSLPLFPYESDKRLPWPLAGKTLIAKAIATDSKSTFFSISASSLMSKYGHLTRLPQPGSSQHQIPNYWSVTSIRTGGWAIRSVLYAPSLALLERANPQSSSSMRLTLSSVKDARVSMIRPYESKMRYSCR